MPGLQRSARRAHRLSHICLALIALALASGGIAEAQSRRSELQRLLHDAANWVYQLQSAKVPELGATHADIAVIDAFFGGDRTAVEKLKRKPGGGRRIVLSYLSIGEAETYRYYWPACCGEGKRPSWLSNENARWTGNFRVRFWHDEWKDIIFRDAASYLKRIVDLGFDGIYLDRVDVFHEVSGPNIRPRAEMINFVRELAAKARSLKPGFLVVAQNAEDLLEDESYLEAIDAVAKEDMLYGVAGEGKRNSADMVRAHIEPLKRARERGKAILVVEYLQSPETIARARTEIMELGFTPTFAPRPLETLQVENLEEDTSH